MIKVIVKVLSILELFGQSEVWQLRDMAEALSINKPTLSNILKTMTAKGLLCKTGDGRYMLGDRLAALAYPALMKNTVKLLASKYALQLNVALDEATVVCVLHDDQRHVLSKTDCRHAVVVNRLQRREDSIYRTATGRALICGFSAVELERFVHRNGLPDAESWPEIGNFEDLLSALQSIRQSGISMREAHCGTAVFLATPVFDPQGKVAAALGVELPAERFRPHAQPTIVQTLCDTGESMGREISFRIVE